jgi:hypothetical protein
MPTAHARQSTRAARPATIIGDDELIRFGLSAKTTSSVTPTRWNSLRCGVRTIKRTRQKGAVVAQTHYAVTRLAPPQLLSHQLILMIHSSLSLVSIQDCQILACASAHARSAPENSFLTCVLYTHVIQMFRQSCSRQCSSLVAARSDNDINFLLRRKDWRNNNVPDQI